jgi:urease accessory protein
MYLDPSSRDMAYIYVQNPTGGVFPGDRLETRLVLDVGAKVHLTTQSATKVYGTNDGTALQSTDATLAAGSYLELIPDLLIPHAGSRLVQKLDVSVAQDAGFFMAEAVAPGRLARGERFEYAVVDLRTRVLDGNRNELVVDALRFEPASRLPDRRGLMGRFSFVGAALAVAPTRDMPQLARALDEACHGMDDDVLAAACLVQGDIGVAVRVLADSHRALRAVLDAVWRVSREALAGAPPPPRRK